jgi:hypothetical protein
MKKVDILLIIFTIIVAIYEAISLIKITTTIAPDFPSYYYATRDLLEHKNPYIDKSIPNIFIYPAVTSIFYIPFTLLPYAIAQGFFVILSAIAVPLTTYFSMKIIFKNFSWRFFLFFTSLAFIAFPTKFTLGMGQVNLLAFLVFLIAFYYCNKKNIIISGILIAASFLLKPILCFMLFFFIMQKAWKLIIATSIAIIFFILLSFILYGYTMELYYINSMVPILVNGVAGREVYYNQGMLGFISRLTDDENLRKYLSSLISLILIVFTFFFINKNHSTRNMQFAIFLTLLLIVHTLSWQHYFVLLIFPFIMATRVILQKREYKCFYLLALSYILISWNFRNPSILINFPLSMLLSHTFYGALILLFVLFKNADRALKKKTK